MKKKLMAFTMAIAMLAGLLLVQPVMADAVSPYTASKSGVTVVPVNDVTKAPDMITCGAVENSSYAWAILSVQEGGWVKFNLNVRDAGKYYVALYAKMAQGTDTETGAIDLYLNNLPNAGGTRLTTQSIDVPPAIGTFGILPEVEINLPETGSFDVYVYFNKTISTGFQFSGVRFRHESVAKGEYDINPTGTNVLPMSNVYGYKLQSESGNPHVGFLAINGNGGGVTCGHLYAGMQFVWKVNVKEAGYYSLSFDYVNQNGVKTGSTVKLFTGDDSWNVGDTSYGTQLTTTPEFNFKAVGDGRCRFYGTANPYPDDASYLTYLPAGETTLSIVFNSECWDLFIREIRIKAAPLIGLVEEAKQHKQADYPNATLWEAMQSRLEKAEAIVEKNENPQSQEALEMAAALKAAMVPMLYDDYSDGLAKTFSHGYFKLADADSTYDFEDDLVTPLKKKVLIRDASNGETPFVIYKVDQDITSFRIRGILDPKYAKKGLYKVSLSPDGADYTPAANVEETIGATPSVMGAHPATTVTCTDVPPGMRYMKIELADVATAGSGWNARIDRVRIDLDDTDETRVNTFRLAELVEEAKLLTEEEYPNQSRWQLFQSKLTAAQNTLKWEEGHQDLDAVLSELEAVAVKVFYDDLSEGLAKMESHQNVKTEQSDKRYFFTDDAQTPVEKTVVWRDQEETTPTMVYKTDWDIASFQVKLFLETNNAKKGLATVSVSADGDTYIPVNNATETLIGMNPRRERTPSLIKCDSVPEGMRYLKIEFADVSQTVVRWNPYLNWVKILSDESQEVPHLEVLNSEGASANGVLTVGKHTLKAKIANTGEACTYICAIALYDDGRMTDVNVKKITSLAQESGYTEVGTQDDISVTVPQDVSGKVVKAFVWENDSISPRKSAVVLQPAE